MPTEHARLSASSASRWMHCPGSIALSEQAPPPKSSSFADEGTTAHALAELKLRQATDDTAFRQYELDTIRANEYYCGEMEEATSLYVDMVLEHLAEHGEGAVLAIEQRVSFNKWVPGGFGTSDAVVISDDMIEVIDLKYGKGIKVEAENNPQLRLYGLGAAELFKELYEFTRVRTTIVQPRLDHVSTEEIALADLLEWADNNVAPAAEAALSGIGAINAGDWCRFCPASALCRKRAEQNLELAKMEFRAPALLSDNEISKVLGQAEALQKWVSDVQDYAFTQALTGRHFEGFKLVEGRSTRKFTDELAVVDALKAAGYNEAMLYERKLYGLSALEKLVGKQKLAETLGDLIVKPAGKPVLVPVSDKRAEYNAAKTDFAD